MKIKSLVLIICCSLFLFSCGTAKKVAGGGMDASMTAKTLIDLHNNKEPDFNTLASRVQVVYDDGSKSQSITVSLRMKKDETIWVTASILGITLAKILITQDNVSYYETIGKTYFDGDFSLLSTWLGTEIDFEMAQNILLGQAVFELNENNYEASVFGENYRLTPKKQSDFFKHIFLLQPNTYKIASQQIMQPQEQRILTVDYGPYQETGGQLFPKTISINAIELQKKTSIQLDYRNIDINPQVNFAFKIPGGYEEIQLD